MSRLSSNSIVICLSLLLAVSVFIFAPPMASAVDTPSISAQGSDIRKAIDHAWELSGRGLSFESAIILKNVPENWSPVSKQEDSIFIADLIRAGNLANMRFDFDSAERFYKDALVEIETNLGGECPDYVMTILKLSWISTNKQDMKQTEKLVTQAATLIEEAFPQPGLDKFLALYRLAGGYMACGKKNSASETYIEAFDIAQKSATEPLEYVRSILALGPWYVYSLEPQHADKVLKDIRGVIKSSIGESTVEFATVLRTTAMLSRAYAGSSEILEMYKTGKYQEAQLLIQKKNNLSQELLQKAVQIHEGLSPQQTGKYIEVLKDLSMVYYMSTDQSKKAKAKEPIEKALLLSQNAYQEKDPSLLTWMTSLQGADFSAHITTLTEAETIAKRVYGKKNVQYSTVVQRLAGAYLGRFNTAHDEADKFAALRLYDSWAELIKNIYGEKSQSYVQTLNSLASIYQQFDKQKAIVLAKESEKISNEMKNDSVGAYSNRLVSAENFIRIEGDYAKAISLYKEVLEKGKDVWGEQGERQYWSSMGRLGSIYVAIGEYGKALKTYAQMKNAFKEQDRWANWNIPMAYVLTKLGEYERAEDLLTPLVEEVTPKSAMAQSMIQGPLGDIYMFTHRYKEAAKCYEEPLEGLKKAFPGMDIEVFANFGSEKIFGLATAKYYLGEQDKAKELMARALSKGLSPKFKVSAAEFYCFWGDLKKADNLLSDALVKIQGSFGDPHPDNTAALTQAALIYEAMGDSERSLVNHLRALAALDEFVSRLSLWASEERLQSYLGTVEQRNDYFYSLIASHYTGEKFESRKIFERHLAYKGKLVEIIASRKKLALLSKNPTLLKTINELKNVTQQISQLSLQSPASMKVEKLKVIIDNLEDKREALEESLARGASEFRSPQAMKLINTEELAASLPPGGVYLDFIEYNKYDYQKKKFIGERHYLAFLLTRDKEGKPVVRIENIGSSASINNLIEKFRVELQNEGAMMRGIAGKRPAARTLDPETLSNIFSNVSDSIYVKLLMPFNEELSAASNLIISPSGSLNLIPFEVLTGLDKTGYLGDRMTISYSLGRDIVAAQYEIQIATEKLNTQLTIVAAPVFTLSKTPRALKLVASEKSHDDQEVTVLSRGYIRGWPIVFSELPGTLSEANAIQEIANNETTLMLIRERALEEKVKELHHPQVLHIATHGFFLEDVEQLLENNLSRGISGVLPTEMAIHAQQESKLSKTVEFRNPLLRSGLALAGANGLVDNIPLSEGAEDGILTAAEVTSMDLYGTDLVVLSACNTGLGEIHHGEGVSGLRRAFRIAGAKNIIMSLWNIPDEETSWLMEAFYKNYFKGKSPASALKSARKTVRARLIERDGVDNPYFWGAFVLEGTGS